MIIRVNHISKTIKKQIVIDDVSLLLHSGAVYGLYGYNGCGKTMLMRLIAGLILPTTGEILIDNKKLGKDIDFPEKMGLLIENPSFLGGLTGLENLLLLASINHYISESTIVKTILSVGLDPHDKKKYKKYSLGMKQRLGIAAAIMEKPDLIILDEPTNALDSEGVKIVKSIINAEKERGALIILTCHDKEVLDEMCDVIYKIEQGKIITQEVEF